MTLVARRKGVWPPMGDRGGCSLQVGEEAETGLGVDGVTPIKMLSGAGHRSTRL